MGDQGFHIKSSAGDEIKSCRIAETDSCKFKNIVKMCYK